MINLPISPLIPHVSNFTNPVIKFENIAANQKQIINSFTPEEKILFERYGHFLKGIDFFAGKKEVEEAINSAYQELENSAEQLFKREQRAIAREKDPLLKEQGEIVLKLTIGEAVQNVTAIHNMNIHKAKQLLNMFGAPKYRMLSEKVLRLATKREMYTKNANDILKKSGVIDFTLNDDYLALLARSKNRNSQLTPKEQAVLADYMNLEREALSRLNKLQRQSYNDQKKYAVGMETMRTNTAKERISVLNRYNRLVKAHNAEAAEKLLNLRDE